MTLESEISKEFAGQVIPFGGVRNVFGHRCEPEQLRDILSRMVEDGLLREETSHNGTRTLTEYRFPAEENPSRSARKAQDSGSTKDKYSYIQAGSTKESITPEDKDNDMVQLLSESDKGVSGEKREQKRQQQQTGNFYPEDEETVIAAAAKIGYLMSIREAAKFLCYGAYGWIDTNGRKIVNWKAMLGVWRRNQRPDSLKEAKMENERRKKGLDPWIPLAEVVVWEYYRDGQNRLFRRPKGRDEVTWEYIRTDDEIIQ